MKRQIPDNAHEIVFDAEKAFEDFPDFARRPLHFVAALWMQNTKLPYHLICGFARQLLMKMATPHRGKEESFLAILAWLEQESQGLKIRDCTDDAEWEAAKLKNMDSWRQ